MITQLRHKGAIKGFKRTPQRLAILDYLEGNTSHPSAEEIYKAVGKRNPSLSFATVYNTVNTLVHAGILRELTIDPDRKRYDPDVSVHHHLICLDCRAVRDVMADIPVAVPKSLAREFTVTGSHIEFYGLCEPCRRRQEKA